MCGPADCVFMVTFILMHGAPLHNCPLAEVVDGGGIDTHCANVVKQANRDSADRLVPFLQKLRLNLCVRPLFFSRQNFFNRCPRSALQHQILQVEHCSHAIGRSEQAVSSLLNLLV